MKLRINLLILLVLIIPAFAQQIIELPTPQKDGGIPLMQALEKRMSNRDFSEKKLSEQVLSNLLWAASGVNREDGRRTAPSAVNWQEIDIYVVMENGAYLYNPVEHRLEKKVDDDLRSVCGKQGFVNDTPINLVYVSDHSKMGLVTPKSQKEFYSATDTGFISQNVYLFCASEGLSTVVLGWVSKDKLARKLKLEDSQHVILTQPVGYPAE